MAEDRVQIIHINSANRVYGTQYDFNVLFPDEIVRAEHNEKIKLIVIDCCINRSWYTVDASNNTFSIYNGTTTTQYTIPQGYYDVYTFKSQFLSLLSGWSINFSVSTNKYTYTPPNDGKTYNFATFTNKSCELLGFSEFYPSSTFTNASPITSVNCVKMNRENAVFIHCDVLKAKFASIDNFSGKLMESDIICKIPMNCAPFDNLIYVSQGNDDFAYDLGITNLNSMHFYVTDENNRELQLVYDWTITLKLQFETGDDDAMLIKTNEIAQYLQLMVLNKHMK